MGNLIILSKPKSKNPVLRVAAFIVLLTYVNTLYNNLYTLSSYILKIF